MSLETVKKLVSIIEFFTRKWDNAKAWFKKNWKVWKARRIRRAIDNGDTKFVGKRVRKIIQKRQERADNH